MNRPRHLCAMLAAKAVGAALLLTACSCVGHVNAYPTEIVHSDGLDGAPDLIVDKVIEVTGTATHMSYRNIVFRPGGKIRIRDGARLVVWARSISAEDGALVEFDGTGEVGAPGEDGAKCVENNCNDWWTERKDEFETSNRNCLPTEYGLKGGPGGQGGAGARINIHVAKLPIIGTFKCNVEGGAGGAGGKGGPGRWHILNTGGLPRYQCGSLGSGATGPRGPEGTCLVSELAPPRTGD